MQVRDLLDQFIGMGTTPPTRLHDAIVYPTRAEARATVPDAFISPTKFGKYNITLTHKSYVLSDKKRVLHYRAVHATLFKALACEVFWLEPYES